MDSVISRLPAARRRAVLALLAALSLAPPAEAADGPPVTVAEFRRLSVEDPRATLLRGDLLVATPYAAAHPEWTRELLFRMARAATLLSDTSRVEQIATRLEAIGREKADLVATAYGALARAAVLADAGRVEDAIGAATKAATGLDAIGETAVAVTVSIGVAMLDCRRHDSIERWMAAADAALYAAKDAGRNRVELAERGVVGGQRSVVGGQ